MEAVPRVDPNAKARVINALIRRQITREEAAAQLNVTVRTIDRYLAHEMHRQAGAVKNVAAQNEIQPFQEDFTSNHQLSQLVASWIPYRDPDDVVKEIDDEIKRAQRTSSWFQTKLPILASVVVSAAIFNRAFALSPSLFATVESIIFSTVGAYFIFTFILLLSQAVCWQIYQRKYPNDHVILGLMRARDVLRVLGERNPWKRQRLPHRDRRVNKRLGRAITEGLATACHKLRDPAWLSRPLELEPARNHEVTARNRSADELAVVEGLLHQRGPESYSGALNVIGLILFMSCLRDWNLHNFERREPADIAYRPKTWRTTKRVWTLITGTATVVIALWGPEVRSISEASIRYVRTTAIPDALTFMDRLQSMIW